MSGRRHLLPHTGHPRAMPSLWLSRDQGPGFAQQRSEPDQAKLYSIILKAQRILVVTRT